MKKEINKTLEVLNINDSEFWELSNKDIAQYYNCDKSKISKGIKRLVELDVIGRLYDKIPNNMLPKNTYIINHNYIYRGSIKKLRKDILEQRNNITD